MPVIPIRTFIILIFSFFRLLSSSRAHPVIAHRCVLSYSWSEELTERTAAKSSTHLEIMMNPIMPDDISIKGIPRQQWASLLEVFGFRKVGLMFWSGLVCEATKSNIIQPSYRAASRENRTLRDSRLETVSAAPQARSSTLAWVESPVAVATQQS